MTRSIISDTAAPCWTSSKSKKKKRWLGLRPSFSPIHADPLAQIIFESRYDQDARVTPDDFPFH